MSQSFLLRGGRLLDPAGNLDTRGDLLIRDGVIAAAGAVEPAEAGRVVDVDGLVVAPGLIDVHVHLREPGQEWKETVGTGTAAAAAGGFTTIFCMPNTEPPLDSVAMLAELRRRTARDALVNVRPIATISEGRRGRCPVDYDALAEAGAVGFSDDGESTWDSGVMRSALEASRRVGLPVIVHCEDPGLTGGAMHEGAVSRELGIRGIPAAAEEIVIGRDLALAALTGGWLHVCHVSTGRGAKMIAAARATGTRVSAEVMTHHLTMTDAWVAGCREFAGAEAAGQAGAVADPDTKVNPPLRPLSDAQGILELLKSGTIEVVATDHAPHAMPEKQGRSFSAAAFGINGSELALPLMLTLVQSGKLSLSEMLRSLTSAPARLWGLPCGSLRPGGPADIVVFDPNEAWTVRADWLASRSANTPLLNQNLRGRVKLTYVAGDERYRDH